MAGRVERIERKALNLKSLAVSDTHRNHIGLALLAHYRDTARPVTQRPEAGESAVATRDPYAIPGFSRIAASRRAPDAQRSCWAVVGGFVARTAGRAGSDANDIARNNRITID